MTNSTITLEQINALAENTLVSHLGIEFIEINQDFVKARMPVDDRTLQPQRVLHGGASATLAETLGSVGSAYHLDLTKQYPVGVELNINHIRSVTSGYVTGTATALHIGQRTHVWDIKIVDDSHKLVSAARLTVMILKVSSR